METKAKLSKDGGFAIPDELSEAHLLDSGLSFIDIRLAPAHLIAKYKMLKHLQSVASEAQAKRAK